MFHTRENRNEMSLLEIHSRSHSSVETKKVEVIETRVDCGFRGDGMRAVGGERLVKGDQPPMIR